MNPTAVASGVDDVDPGRARAAWPARRRRGHGDRDGDGAHLLGVEPGVLQRRVPRRHRPAPRSAARRSAPPTRGSRSSPGTRQRSRNSRVAEAPPRYSAITGPLRSSPTSNAAPASPPPPSSGEPAGPVRTSPASTSTAGSVERSADRRAAAAPRRPPRRRRRPSRRRRVAARRGRSWRSSSPRRWATWWRTTAPRATAPPRASTRRPASTAMVRRVLVVGGDRPGALAPVAAQHLGDRRSLEPPVRQVTGDTDDASRCSVGERSRVEESPAWG